MSKKKSTKRGKYEIIILKDNDHTVNDISMILTEYCGHNHYQAEQCAIITHNTGKCSAFVDTYNICTEIYEYIIHAGLTCKIQKKK